MKLILPLINKLKRKRLLINRASESYKKASHIGILYSYIDENKQRAINEFVEKLKKDGKKLIYYLLLKIKMLIIDILKPSD